MSSYRPLGTFLLVVSAILLVLTVRDTDSIALSEGLTAVAVVGAAMTVFGGRRPSPRESREIVTL